MEEQKNTATIKRTTSMKIKILASFLSVVTICGTLIGFIVFRTMRTELMQSAQENLEYVSQSIADIFLDMNEREYKMLRTIASVPLVKDPNVSIWKKYRTVREVAVEDKTYIDVTILTKDGFAPATTEGGKMISFKERLYYQEPMKGNNYVTDPFINKVTGAMAIFYAVPVHSSTTGEICNVVFAVLDGYRMCDIINTITIGKSSHPLAINKKTGNIIAAASTQLLDEGKNIKDITGVDVNNLFNGELVKEDSGMGYYTQNNKQMIAFYRSVPGTDWVTFAAIPISDFQGSINSLMRTIVLLFLLMFVIVGIVCMGMLSMSLKPLNTANASVVSIATGNADLTQRVPVSSHDEIGVMVNGINMFIAKLQEIVSEIKESQGDLSTFGDKLGLMVQENTTFVTNMVEGIKTQETEFTVQSNKIQGAVEATDEISQGISQLGTLLSTQETSVESASAAVTQMIGNIESVSHSMEMMAGEFSDLQSDISNGIESAREVNNQLKGIGEQSKMLDEANLAISSIAEQTSLLAMNAAIEAAHAGEAGKGFAVVADEIRKLSENSSSQSKTIKEQLATIIDSIDTVVETSNNNDKIFTRVGEKLTGTSNLVQEIKLAMEEQTEGSKQIGQSLSDMNSATKQVRDSSDNVEDARKKIIEDVEAMRQSTLTIEKTLDSIRHGINLIEKGDDSVMAIATKISSAIYKINSQIGQFQV